jgi:hypothetical protein
MAHQEFQQAGKENICKMLVQYIVRWEQINVAPSLTRELGRIRKYIG